MNKTRKLQLDAGDAVLVIIDMQEKLAAAMPDKVREQVLRSVEILAQGAKALDLPVLVTEQYPQGLGGTLPELAPYATEAPMAKTSFSCLGCEAFVEQLASLGRKQVILAGMETHICVYQTALALLEEDYRVWIPGECVCSRSKRNWRNGLHLTEQAGGIVSNVETVLFQMLGQAGGDAFKTISKLIK